MLTTEVASLSDLWNSDLWTSMNFAHLASFRAIEFVDSGQTSENKAVLTKHSIL